VGKARDEHGRDLKRHDWDALAARAGQRRPIAKQEQGWCQPHAVKAAKDQAQRVRPHFEDCESNTFCGDSPRTATDSSRQLLPTWLVDRKAKAAGSRYHGCHGPPDSHGGRRKGHRPYVHAAALPSHQLRRMPNARSSPILPRFPSRSSGPVRGFEARRAGPRAGADQHWRQHGQRPRRRCGRAANAGCDAAGQAPTTRRVGARGVCLH